MVEHKKFVLNGHNITTIEEFYDEVHRILCPCFDYFGRDWEGLNDILRGGFGTYGYGEEIILEIRYRNYMIKHLGLSVIKKFEKIVRKNKNVQLVYLDKIFSQK